MPSRIQLSRKKGWRKPEGAVVVSRPGKWGNPFTIAASAAAGHSDPRAHAVHSYEAWVKGEIAPEMGGGAPPSLEKIRAELGGKDLACWCSLDGPCHGDVLLRLANDDQ
ncbi:DUF4326 domain-containing protein [Breoghania sp.]|uniref:DUF4326 domain-containing protein n=1 Tax=Breoghania sp. TaxID=2065378 RepID=UPI002AA785D5|nr:DUF4326 domain-containing protein [Breoghania sp.]